MDDVKNAEKEEGKYSEKAEQGKVREINPSSKEKILLQENVLLFHFHLIFIYSTIIITIHPHLQGQHHHHCHHHCSLLHTICRPRNIQRPKFQKNILSFPLSILCLEQDQSHFGSFVISCFLLKSLRMRTTQLAPHCHHLCPNILKIHIEHHLHYNTLDPKFLSLLKKKTTGQQLLGLCTLEPMLCNKRRPRTTTRESPHATEKSLHAATKTQHSQKVQK